MKIEFENEQEREALKHILSEWFIYNNDYDVLGCEPGCRNEDSPGCDWCIKKNIEEELNDNSFSFWLYGGEEWVLNHTIAKKEGSE